VVLTVVFAAFMSKLDTFVVNISLPSIARDFGVGPVRASWVVLSFLIAVTSSLLILGKLADRLGLKRVFMAGYAVFTLGSVLCALSGDLPALVASRCLQGLGGAMLLISGYALIPRFLPEKSRGVAFGALTAAAAVGATVGAPLGGAITRFLSWHWVFWINVPVGIVAMAMAWRLLPQAAPAPTRGAQRFDWAGAVLSSLGIGALVYGLNRGGEEGWGSPGIVAALASAVLLLAGFLWSERACLDPLLELRLFKRPGFRYAVGAMCFAFLVFAGNPFLMPFYLEGVAGLDPASSGLLFLVYTSFYVVAGPVAGRISDRLDPRVLCSASMFSAALACVTFALSLGGGGLRPAAAFLVWSGISFGFFVAPNNNLIMSQAPDGRHGAVSGAFNTLSNLSQVIGVVLFESVFAAGGGPAAAASGAAVGPAAGTAGGFAAAYLAGAACCALSAAVSRLSLRRELAS
jgi:EmrB/QacA subfamily drug resistance transporter